MTARKSERLLNLLITLLVSRTYVTKDRLREVVEPYREAGDDAFEKMFERDKEELRSLGIPIEVGYVDRAFEDEPGYRVERSAFELPEIDLAPEEAAVIGLAARVWQHAGLAAATSDALVKLKAAGVTVDRAALDVVQPTAERRGAGLRAALGRHAHPDAGAVRLPQLVGGACLDPAPPALGRGVLPRPVVRHGAGHRPRRAAGLPALPRPGRRLHRREAGLLRGPAGHRPACHDRSRWPRPRRTGPPSCWCGRAAAHGLRRHAQPVRVRRRPDGLGAARRDATGRRTRSPTRCSGTAPTWSCWRPEDVREYVVRRLREAAGEQGTR